MEEVEEEGEDGEEEDEDTSAHGWLSLLFLRAWAYCKL